jgi:hypothetical protein
MANRGMPMFDIVSFIESLEIGSNIEEEGWTSPTELSVPVISSEENGTGILTGPTGSSDTEVVVVLVIPYTGGTEPAGQTVGEQGSADFP